MLPTNLLNKAAIPARCDEVIVLVNVWTFLNFLSNHSAANILVGSTRLVLFAVYTCDVVAASRRKRAQGAA